LKITKIVLSINLEPSQQVYKQCNILQFLIQSISVVPHSSVLFGW